MSSLKKVLREGRSFDQKASDTLSTWAGSWYFIILLLLFLIFWMALNAGLVLIGVWDPYPFILLNLGLSMLAAILAPIILMSQNRSAERDRTRSERDYYINRKAEREIKELQIDILEIKSIVTNQSQTEEIKQISEEIKKIQEELASAKH